MISKFKVNSSDSSVSSSEERSESQFNGRHVENSESMLQRADFADSSSEEDVSPKLLARLAEIEATGIQKVICFKQHTEAELVKGYADAYSSGEFGNISLYALMRLGSRDSTGTIHGLLTHIYNRLLKIGFILKPGLILSQFPMEKQNSIILPMFEIGSFDMVDHFGWFCRNDEIAQKFNKIMQSFRMMQSLEEICYQKIEKFDYNPVVNFGHISSFRNQPNKLKNTPNILNVAHTEPHRLEQKERMQEKQKALSYAHNKNAEDKKDVLACLKHYESVWVLISMNLHPCKANAYMLFEALLNHTLDTLRDLGQDKFDKNTYKSFIISHLSRSFNVLAQTLELLLPYAMEITKSFDIDLNSDDKLLSVFNIKKGMESRLANDEFQEYIDLQKEVDGFSKSQNVQRQRQR
jgi:hypothetical protein